MAELRAIVGHYQGNPPNGMAKIDLMLGLHITVLQYELGPDDATAIIRASQAGLPLPPRKTLSLQPVAKQQHHPYHNPSNRQILRFLEESARIRGISLNYLWPATTAHASSTASTSSSIDVDQQLSCDVCFEVLDLENRLDRHPSLVCSHETEVCRDYLIQSKSTQFNGRIWNHIDCPCCGARMTADDVNRFGDQDLVLKSVRTSMSFIHYGISANSTQIQ